MPLIEVSLIEGRSPQTLRTLIHELHRVAVQVLGDEPSAVRVILREVPETHWSAGDVTIAERRGRK
ncbi:4-oxalocrotonate tautomerase [Nocardia sp. GAS34]|uniref:tautomerase family protein n=1 Tax=unclassified Nocardia TaxID=2637762 RepID=UPI003D1EC6C1